MSPSRERRLFMAALTSLRIAVWVLGLLLLLLQRRTIASLQQELEDTTVTLNSVLDYAVDQCRQAGRLNKDARGL